MAKGASAFRSIRFRISEAHGCGIAILLNTSFDADAVLGGRDATLRVNHDEVKDAVDALARELLTIQAASDYDEGEGTARQAGCCPRPEVGRVLDRLDAIPVDIEPGYATGLTP